AGQAPLHGVRAAGVGPGGEDAEVAARLCECLHIDASPDRLLLNVAHALGAMGERVLEELLRALAAFGRLLCRVRCFARLAAGPGGEVVAKFPTRPARRARSWSEVPKASAVEKIFTRSASVRSGATPACRNRFLLAAKPAFAGPVHVDLAVIAAAGKMKNPLALAVHIALDDTLGRRSTRRRSRHPQLS